MAEAPNLRKASHIGLWFISLGVVGWLLWSATHNNTKNQRFSGDSKQTNNYHIVKNYALGFVDFALMPFNIRGCVRPDKLDYEPQKAQEDVVDTKMLVNAVKSETEMNDNH